MWIEIKFNGDYQLLNMASVRNIKLHQRTDVKPYVSLSGAEFIFDDDNDARAWYEGFILAINGLDFVFDESSYIKPLLQSKNEVFYRHIMLKEVLGDRK